MIDTKKRDETYYKWEKENAVRYSIKLMKSTDSDIINYMENKPKQATFKKAIRFLMEHEQKNINGGNDQ